SQPMGFYQPAQLVRDARQHAVEVREADVNFSEWDCTLEPFTSPRRGEVDARSASGEGRSELQSKLREPLTPTLAAPGRGSAGAANELRVAVRLDLRPEPEVALPPMALSEHVAEDYLATGLSLKAHPIGFFRDRLTCLGARRNAELRDERLRQDQMVTVAGLVLIRQQPGTANGVIFMTLEDETDIANIIVWPKVFAKHRRTVMTSRFLAVRGPVQRAGLVVHVVARSFIDLSAELRLLRDGDLAAP